MTVEELKHMEETLAINAFMEHFTGPLDEAQSVLDRFWSLMASCGRGIINGLDQLFIATNNEKNIEFMDFIEGNGFRIISSKDKFLARILIE